MTSMLHTFHDASSFQHEVQLAEVENVVPPKALATALAKKICQRFWVDSHRNESSWLFSKLYRGR